MVLSRQTVQVQQLDAALTGALISRAESNAQAAEALRRLVIGCIEPQEAVTSPQTAKETRSATGAR